MDDSAVVVRETEALCAECIKVVPARTIEVSGAIYLEKNCPQHGTARVLLSRHPWYWRELDGFYLALMKKSRRQRDFIIRLTDRCNMECCICLASANERPVPDLPLDDLRRFLRGRHRHKIDLMGAEPTVRDDLEDVIRTVKASGNIASLHTNGIKLADFAYAERLKAAGLNEVHLQFDALDDDSYMRIRGMPMTALKRRVLDNLRRLNI
ncbi:radical SAM protein, partial [bacterium]|nr:radical SAM protein [candidate division CSSED10-310 bacterium]